MESLYLRHFKYSNSRNLSLFEIKWGQWHHFKDSSKWDFSLQTMLFKKLDKNFLNGDIFCIMKVCILNLDVKNHWKWVGPKWEKFLSKRTATDELMKLCLDMLKKESLKSNGRNSDISQCFQLLTFFCINSGLFEANDCTGCSNTDPYKVDAYFLLLQLKILKFLVAILTIRLVHLI